MEEARNSWAGQFLTLLEFSELTNELNALVFWLLSIRKEEAVWLGSAEPSHPGGSWSHGGASNRELI